MDRRLKLTDEAGDYVVPNVLSPRDLVSRPDNMDETVLSSSIDEKFWSISGNISSLFQVSADRQRNSVFGRSAYLCSIFYIPCFECLR